MFMTKDNKSFPSLQLLAALSSIGLTAPAFAQSAFEGFYGQVGIGYENSTPSYSGGTLNGVTPGPLYSYGMSGGTTNSFAATATIGYYFPVTGNFLLGVGAEYSPLSGVVVMPPYRFQRLNTTNLNRLKKVTLITSLFLLLTLLIKRSSLTLRWDIPMLIMKLAGETIPITATP